jgi:hypothetical protein
MHASTEPTSAAPNQQASPPSCPALCPVCAGRLVYLRSQYRCSRCCYSFCVGCEDGPTAEPGGQE